MSSIRSSKIFQPAIPLDQVNDAVLLVSRDAHIAFANPRAAALLGYQVPQLIALPLKSIWPDFVMEKWASHWVSNGVNQRAGKQLSLQPSQPSPPYETTYETWDGTQVDVEVVSSRIMLEGSEYELVLIRDLTARNNARPRAAEVQLQRESYLRTLMDNFPFMVWLKDADSRLLVANSAYAKMAGVASPEDLEGKTDFDFFPEELAAQYVKGDREAMQSDKPVGTICAIQNAEGQYYWIESYKSPLIVDGMVVGTLGYARDVTETLQKEREYRSLVENSPNQIVRFDQNCKRVFMNARNCEVYGVSPEFLLGKSPSEYPGTLSAIAYEEMIREVFKSKQNQTFDLKLESPEGRTRIIHTTLAGELGDNGDVMSVIGVGRDVTEIMENQERIHRLAYFDTLTNLPNRDLLTDRISQSIVKARRHGHHFSLMMLDLDRFKEINDTLGHAVGDALLGEVAMRLNSCLRDDDTVARLGGDEFAILLSELHASFDITTVATKLIAAFKTSFLVQDAEIYITASIGIAIYPTDSMEVSNLFKFADSAMYHAKKQGRNNFQFYSTAMTDQATERRNIETSLRSAMQNEEFELYYQPQLNLETEEVIGAEALLRWHSEGKILTPDKFIDITEESGLIIGIGEWVIGKVCEVAVLWNSGRATPFTFAINLSTRQFIRNDLVSTLRSALSGSGCKAEWLKLEITESLLLEDNEMIQDMLQQLHDMGFCISIDDFGTGYSALSYLNRFPVGQIKIDKSFVRDITENPDRGMLVQAIISMALNLRKSLVAEGVETTEQAAYLKAMGCPQAQGYLYGKPMPHEQLKLLYG
jgi:diguanylate cyclase (GGDEF)-like protein/PAS domain S-box-containing protein